MADRDMPDDLVDRIRDILRRHKEVPQELKDELILMGLEHLLTNLQDYNERLKFLEKYRPYLKGLAFAVGVIAASLLGMLITGRLQLTIIP